MSKAELVEENQALVEALIAAQEVIAEALEGYTDDDDDDDNDDEEDSAVPVFLD